MTKLTQTGYFGMFTTRGNAAVARALDKTFGPGSELVSNDRLATRYVRMMDRLSVRKFTQEITDTAVREEIVGWMDERFGQLRVNAILEARNHLPNYGHRNGIELRFIL